MEGPIGSIGRGELLTFGAAIAFAAHIVATGHFAEQIGYKVLSVTQIGAAALSALSLVWWVETPRVQWQPLVVWAILITGLLCTALAFTIQAWAQQYTTSTRTGLIYALEPVVAWITSYCIAGEGLSGQAAAGAALILSGVLMVEMKPFKPRQHGWRGPRSNWGCWTHRLFYSGAMPGWPTHRLISLQEQFFGNCLSFYKAVILAVLIF